MNGYELSRLWFDWCFENPDKVKPNHTALYFFCIEHCNRLGWKLKFGLPTTMAKEAIGMRSYNTYINTLNDLVEWGFVELIEKSKNQYSSNIVALSNSNKAHDKALDKALIKHGTKQSESTGESIDSIDKQETIEPLTINQEQEGVYFQNEELNSVFSKWLQMCKEKRKEYSQSSIEQLQMKLTRDGDKTAIRKVSQSLENGWVTLQPLDEKKPNPKKVSIEELTDDDYLQ